MTRAPSDAALGASTVVGDRKIFAHQLVSVRRPDAPDLKEVPRDLVAILTGLEGHLDSSFTVQWLCNPRVGDPRGGTITITVITVIDAAADDHRMEEVADDVLDLLNGPPMLWRFEPITDDEQLAAVLRPLDAQYVAEIARHEEELPQTPSPASFGFAGTELVDRPPVRHLWTLWTLGPPAEDTDRLAATLLAQEAPVCLRMTLEPTRLNPSERDSLEDLVHDTAPVHKETSSYRAAHQTLESLLYLRPLFRATCVVASNEALSPSLLSTIGHTLSEPPKHVEPPPPALSGGYAVLRTAALQAEETFALPSSGGDLPSLAPPALAGIRRMFGVWEASNLFRLPVLGEHDVQGLPVNESPVLPGNLSHLPSEGTRIGSIPLLTDRPVSITPTDRFRHTYVVGQTGTGKSTLMQNMALDDIAAGHGVCVIDPHGDLVDAILERLPEDRIDDVVLVDPGDQESVVGVNLIEAESEVQQNYLVSELSNMFYALFDPERSGIVGPRFETMLRQSVLLLQSGDVPASFLDVATVFTDRAVREHLTRQVRDPILAEYWHGEVVQNRSNEWGEVVSWFRSKFEVFRTSTLLRRVVGQAESTFTFTDALRSQKIVLINLSKGAIGEYNSALLGHVIVMKLWGSILERALVPPSERRDFFVYIDEFQNFTTDSLDTMLAEARKYGVGLTLANQFFDQLSTKTRAALLGNVGSKLAFRLGPSDADAFTSWIGGDVRVDELVHLANHQVVAALSPAGMPTAPVLLHTHPPTKPVEERAAQTRARSRAKHGRPIAEIDESFTKRWAVVPGSIAAGLFPEAKKAEVGLDDASAGAAAQATGSTTFLDDWLFEYGQSRARNWTWIDSWLFDQLGHVDSDEQVVIRGTLKGADDIYWEDFATRLGLDPAALREQLVDGSGFLTLDRPTAGRLALELRARGLGAEWFTRSAVASADVPPEVPIRALHLPHPVELELMLEGIVMVGELREASAERIASLPLPAALLADVRALRGEAEPSPWHTLLGTRDGPANLRTALSGERLESLAKALAKQAALRSRASFLTGDEVTVEQEWDDEESGVEADEESAPDDPATDWFVDLSQRRYRAELTFEVIQRLPEIIQLLGEPQ